MTTLTIAGSAATLPAELPLREDGTNYPFSMLNRGNGEITFAETRTELVGHIIDGYDQLPQNEEGHDNALWLRYRAAVQFAGAVQAVVAAAESEAGNFEASLISETDRTAMFGDKGEKPDDIKNWAHKVPLVLISTDYAPYTSTQAPEGNILWINPHNETVFLNSLHEIGVIALYIEEQEG